MNLQAAQRSIIKKASDDVQAQTPLSVAKIQQSLNDLKQGWKNSYQSQLPKMTEK